MHSNFKRDSSNEWDDSLSSLLWKTKRLQKLLGSRDTSTSSVLRLGEVLELNQNSTHRIAAVLDAQKCQLDQIKQKYKSIR